MTMLEVSDSSSDVCSNNNLFEFPLMYHQRFTILTDSGLNACILCTIIHDALLSSKHVKLINQEAKIHRFMMLLQNATKRYF